MSFADQLSRLLHRAQVGLFDLLFPPRCVACQQPGSWLCATCQATIEPIQPPYCGRCGRPLTSAGWSIPRSCPMCMRGPFWLDGIRAVAYHEGVLRTAIHCLKYRNHQALAEPLGSLLAEYVRRTELEATVVVPVPLHGERLAQRGYNQAALLARVLGRALGLPVVEGSLVRVRHTLPQVDLNAAQRRENVRDAFRCVDDRLAGHRVLLVDDVYTTGATLLACGAALHQARVASAWGLTLSHGR